jgi:hypothetical protein
MIPRLALALSCALLGYSLGRLRATETEDELVRLAMRCADRFDALAVETVRCARIVGVKPAGNRRRELPYASDILTGGGGKAAQE